MQPEAPLLRAALLILLLQEDASWRYKTFYYSSSPSWRELQQLQAQQCRCIATAGHTANAVLSKVPAEPADEPAKGAAWTMPAQFQQRLTQRQHFMGQLLSAVQHGHQPVGSNAAGTHAPGCSSGERTEASGGSSSGLITVHSSDNMFEGGTGCHMWDAGFLLAEFVLNNPHIFAGEALSLASQGFVCCPCVSTIARFFLGL